MDIKNRHYIILQAKDLDAVQWSDVLEDRDSVRFSNNGSHFVVKYDGPLPQSLQQFRAIEYTYEGIQRLLNTSEEWMTIEEPGLYD